MYKRQLAVRRVVITARRHAEWVAANPRVTAEKRALRAEMGLWLRVWLENPGVFGAWENLRTRTHLNFPDTHEAGGAS